MHSWSLALLWGKLLSSGPNRDRSPLVSGSRMENKVYWNTPLPTRNFYQQSRPERANQGRERVASPLQPANEWQGTQGFLCELGLTPALVWALLLHLDLASGPQWIPSNVTASSPGSWEAAAAGKACSDGRMRWLQGMGDTQWWATPGPQGERLLSGSGPLVDKVMNIFCRFSCWASFCSLLIFKCYLFWKDIKRKERSGCQQLYHVPFCSYFCKAAKRPFEKWKTEVNYFSFLGLPDSKKLVELNWPVVWWINQSANICSVRPVSKALTVWLSCLMKQNK